MVEKGRSPASCPASCEYSQDWRSALMSDRRQDERPKRLIPNVTKMKAIAKVKVIK